MEQELSHQAKMALCEYGQVSYLSRPHLDCREESLYAVSDLLQTITHPSVSLWTCTTVPTTSGSGLYIATGSNDAVIRFFTREKELMAPVVVREKWTQEVSQRQLDK